ncbi:hypothetical protein DAT39_014752, partial [Clarias magur]
MHSRVPRVVPRVPACLDPKARLIVPQCRVRPEGLRLYIIQMDAIHPASPVLIKHAELHPKAKRYNTLSSSLPVGETCDTSRKEPLTRPPVIVGMSINIASIDSISEVNM